jgi:SAM-dependent methyltransferase
VLACVICDRETPSESAEQASVASNVRAYSGERFAYWRCRHCRSIHARDQVDLAHYYARYPFHDLPSDWRFNLLHTRQLARLRRAGLERSHKILDYGCGSGSFVRFLHARGYSRARGFDEYREEYKDRSLLGDRYDCIISQDVIEHVSSPNALLAELGGATEDGAIVAVGTPNASAIDLTRPREFVHAIHAPYHRHIFSSDALIDAGRRQGLALRRFYSTMYTNTPVPFLNEAFYRYYGRMLDDTLDVVTEPVHSGALFLRLPVTLFWGVCGAFFSRHTDVMAVFQKTPGQRVSGPSVPVATSGSCRWSGKRSAGRRHRATVSSRRGGIS